MDNRKGDLVMHMVRRMIEKQYLGEETASFYIFRTDNNHILARGIVGYENAKAAATRLRKQYKLKFDQLSFKKEYKNRQSRDMKQSKDERYNRNRQLMQNPKYAKRQRDSFSISGSGGSRAYTHHKDWDE